MGNRKLKGENKSQSFITNELKELSINPQDIFKFSSKQDAHNNFNKIAKYLLDPLAKKYSVLDEIYVDGLDATQVFGQSKMVLDGVVEKLLFERIPELKEQFGIYSNGEIKHNLESESDSDEDLEKSGLEEIDEDEEDIDSDVNTLNEEQFEGFSGDEEEEKKESDSEAESDTETQIPSDVEEFEEKEQTKDVFGLNDEFFDIDEFNKQTLALEEGDDQDNNPDDEGIDYFGSISEEDDEEEEMPYFGDFYQKPGQVLKSKATKSKKQNDGEEEEEDEFDETEYDTAVGSAMNDLFADEEEDLESRKAKKASDTGKTLSSFEKQQQQLQAEIAELEAELLADKKWTMKGEIASKDRPQDSLLDDEESNVLEFERTAKPVPVITDEVTESIEDLIKRRIKDDEFDDLPKRIITDVSKFHNRQKFELSESKSERSLAELYEDDYNKVDSKQQEISEEVKKQHDEISDLFTIVNHHLDSLCSAHYVPKPHQFKSIDIKVNDNAASINMEDAQPIHVSSESTLAPQEIYKLGDDKPKANGVAGKSEVQLKSGLSYSKEELSREDKQRLRRAAKRKKAKHFNERKELQEQENKQNDSNKQPGSDRKRQRVGEVIDTLSKAKNVTLIGNKGEMRDVKGNIKKSQGPQGSSNFKL